MLHSQGLREGEGQLAAFSVVIYLPLTVVLAGSIHKTYELARAACACTCSVYLHAHS